MAARGGACDNAGVSVEAASLCWWDVEVRGGEPAESAATELRAAQRVGRRSVGAGPASGEGGVIRVEIDGDAPTPGFLSVVDDGSVRLVAAGPRDLLDGVAWLCERFGVIVPGPGMAAAGTSTGVLGRGRVVHRPAFGERGLVLGCDGLHEGWRDWLRFASGNGLSTVFFHDTPPSRLNPSDDDRGRGGRMFEFWDREGEEVRALAARFGLRLEFGGHHLSALVPREAFAEHPEWFRFDGRARTGVFNLCVSSAGARAQLREGARRFFERFPGFDVYHLWPDDLRGGGWCACEGCAGLSPSDQALTATNVVAEVLREVAPGAEVTYLAYHDTLEAPTRVEPAGNVVALWAPRNRCYAHALDDGGCPRNVEHLASLERLASWFGGAERVRVFEYYSDGILFKWMTPPHLGILPRDMAAYVAAGVAGVYDLAVSPRPWVGPMWHAWWFARCAREGSGDTTDGLATFCEATFGRFGEGFVEVYRRLDAACRLLLDRGDLEPLADGDVLDYGDTPAAALGEIAERAGRALGEFAAAVRALPIALDGSAREAVDELAPTVAAGMHLAERVMGWRAALEGRREEALAHLGMAEVHLRALRDWHHAHAGPAWAGIGGWMLRGASRQMDRIRAMV